MHPNVDPQEKAEWTRKFQVLEDANQNLEKVTTYEMHEYGLWLHDAIINEPPELELVVLLIIAAAGTGKTRGWAKRAAAEAHADTGTGALIIIGRRLHTIYACPTIRLMDEIRGHLTEFRCDPKIITMINSTEKRGVSVQASLLEYFATMPKDREAILICSHTAMIDYFPVIQAPEWDLVFDEMPDMTKFLEFYIPSYHWRISSNVDATPSKVGGAYELTAKEGEIIERYPEGEHVAAMRRMAINEPYDELREHFVEFARALALHRTVLVPQDQWDALTKGDYTGTRFGGLLNALIITGPNHIRRFRSVRMMGARAGSNLSKMIWERYYGALQIPDPNQVRFEEDTSLGLPKKHNKNQSSKVRIWYIFDEPTTRSTLARRVGAFKLFVLVCRAVAEFHARLPVSPMFRRFVWSAPMMEKAAHKQAKPHGVPNDFWSRNNEGKHIHAFDPLLRLDGKPHGINEYKTYRNVALLSVVNLTPHQYELLHAVGLSDEEIQAAIGFDQIYQAALRIGIRSANVDHVCNLTVMDKATADDLAGEFINPKVKQYPAALIEDLMKGNERKHGQKKPKSGNSSDRVRAYRARQRADRLAAKEKKHDT